MSPVWHVPKGRPKDDSFCTTLHRPWVRASSEAAQRILTLLSGVDGIFSILLNFEMRVAALDLIFVTGLTLLVSINTASAWWSDYDAPVASPEPEPAVTVPTPSTFADNEPAFAEAPETAANPVSEDALVTTLEPVKPAEGSNDDQPIFQNIQKIDSEAEATASSTTPEPAQEALVVKLTEDLPEIQPDNIDNQEPIQSPEPEKTKADIPEDLLTTSTVEPEKTTPLEKTLGDEPMVDVIKIEVEKPSRPSKLFILPFLLILIEFWRCEGWFEDNTETSTVEPVDDSTPTSPAQPISDAVEIPLVANDVAEKLPLSPSGNLM